MLGKYADSSTKPVSTSSVSPSTPKPSSSGREESQSLGRAKVEDIEFEIITCTLTADQRLVLEIMILNQGKVDKEFSILNSSILYDNFGQEYKNAIREIGSKKAEGFVGQLKHLFVRNIPTKVTVTYNKVDPDASTISLLNLKFIQLNDAQFRNVPIARR
jgi:hypothetical protein